MTDLVTGGAPAVSVAPVTSFDLPDDRSATEPPEARGLRRDEVRLLVAGDGPPRHARFTDLPSVLEPGDLLVVNTSATLPAAIDGWRADGTAVVVHLAGPADAGDWIAELRRPDLGRLGDGRTGERIALPRGATATLLAPHPDRDRRVGGRLWRARLRVDGPLTCYLEEVGRPITYGHLRGHWPLSSYQTIFARHPGSAEMPSAGRPFSRRLLVDLAVRGVAVAPLTLHCGLSSPESDEPPQPERFRIPEATARLVSAVRAAGGRIVAVGTTVVRALETGAYSDGSVAAAEGWTDLVLGPGRPARAVDGLITGWHEPSASHLLVQEAVVGPEHVQGAYAAALEARYRWHEFGDSCLLLAR